MRKILLATAAGFAAMVADGVTPARAQSAAEVSGQTPQPGLTGYVQGRFRFYGAIVSQDGDSAPFTAVPPPATGGKLANYDFFEYGRIWVGADGVAANGLRYGARLEIRMPYPATTARGDGRGTLSFRRAVGYVGTPTLGQLRFGSGTVQAVEQMYTGHIMGSIASGLLDGEFSPAVFTGQGGVLANNFFYSSSSVNNNSAIGYYSPQFFGFDIGLSYAPNDGNLGGLCGTGGANFVGCDQVSSSADANTVGRLRNQFDAMLRYRGTFGPVGLTASGGFRTADTVNNANPAGANYKRVNIGIFGAQLSWAGLTVGGITTFGSYNYLRPDSTAGFYSLPKSGAGVANRDAFSWQLGASYTIGAITVGAAYHELRTEGNTSNTTGKRKDQGFGLGASYALAPGLALFAEYIYSKVSERGADFIGASFTGGAGNQESFKASVGLLGVSISW
jgi:predicted porin